MMLAVRSSLSQALSSRLEAPADPPAVLRQLIVEHEAMLQAVSESDGETARRLALEHLCRFYGESSR